MSDIFDAYDATAHLLFEEPTCITWIGGLSLPECVRRFGGDSLRTRAADFEDIYEEGYDLDPDDPRVNGDAYVKWAEHGHVLHAFDPLALDAVNPDEAEVSWVVEHGVGLDAWAQNWFAATLTLAEKITSVRFDAAWPERTHVGVTVGPMPWPELRSRARDVPSGMRGSRAGRRPPARSVRAGPASLRRPDPPGLAGRNRP